MNTVNRLGLWFMLIVFYISVRRVPNSVLEIFMDIVFIVGGALFVVNWYDLMSTPNKEPFTTNPDNHDI